MLPILLTSALLLSVSLLLVVQLRFVVVWVSTHKTHGTPLQIAEGTDPAPLIAIQIPTYREAPALPRLLEAIVALNWPRDRMFVQVIDDSEGTDAEEIRKVVDAYLHRGVAVHYLHRNIRDGFKAGALNYALASAANAEFIAYFDADCCPRPAFLQKIVPLLRNPKVAAVQARWEFPNALKSPLALSQAAAFEYLFSFELEARRHLDVPAFFLGSAAVWRRTALTQLGGYREKPFTAEDVDIGNRALTAGWQLVYQPEALADSPSLEDVLAFRAQQRRWSRAVAQASLHMIPSLTRRTKVSRAWLLESTSLLPHIGIPLAMVIGILTACDALFRQVPLPFRDAVEWVFSIIISMPAAGIALVLAMRRLHRADWRRRACLLLLTGPVAAATMTSFCIGLADFARSRSAEWAVTPKSGQMPVLNGSQARWARSFLVPILLDCALAVLFLSGAMIASSKELHASIVGITILGAAYLASAVWSLTAAIRLIASMRSRSAARVASSSRS